MLLYTLNCFSHLSLNIGVREGYVDDVMKSTLRKLVAEIKEAMMGKDATLFLTL